VRACCSAARGGDRVRGVAQRDGRQHACGRRAQEHHRRRDRDDPFRLHSPRSRELPTRPRTPAALETACRSAAPVYPPGANRGRGDRRGDDAAFAGREVGASNRFLGGQSRRLRENFVLGARAHDRARVRARRAHLHFHA